jgi:NADP-dependent 3-hydroxy acid dehydrogenase YdfG
VALLAEGSSALVTGASRGIGLAIARALAGAGARVAMVARTRDALAAAARAVGGTAFVADLTDDAGIDKLTAQVRSHFEDVPDILVNAAGAFTLAPLAETSRPTFDAVIAANLRAPFALMSSFLPRMLERGSGHIVSIGSVAGRQAFAGNAAYSASKFGLRGLHEVLEQELRGTGVRASLIEPAATDTELWDAIDYTRFAGLPERAQMLSAETVADAVLFVVRQPANVGIKYLGMERS